ncbi:heme lyase CcmF/NrfE family subunit [Acidicapsa acidisoli]|uniref:heme lyase CcmF/NrfE family subunit n=1 Tax=Acidicapsa acidisoli TaxID=1615681 RepID=UPI0021DF9E7A|nr:cytochrome c-type biogenesis CcmF C-terminal domain-containing protein [Acidicapsa acidisoli]
MAAFGSFALLIGLALAAYNLFAGGIALRLLAVGGLARVSPERLAETARRAGIAGFAAVTAAAFALSWSVFHNDFSIEYIVEHSNIALPAPYKFAALWSGQEGSLLLWAWLLAAYGFVLRLTHKSDVKLHAYAGTILAGVQVFFLLLLNFAAPPFSLVRGGVAPADGNGLNPLLQYPEMVIHPPMLYLGYVGFTVPFAFALGALMMRYPGEKWIHITRRWTMFTWMFLTIGIFLGMHWAYAVLGWGGYWGWDPVENASLMPWLTGTAFLHSVMMQEKRGMMKSWNVWLIFSTFMLSILGTLLTRAGLVSSVHAFAQSSIGNWFVAFLVLIAVVCIFTFVLQKDHLKSEHRVESLVSRESSFLFNNLVLLAACFTILWGTLFPVLSEYVEGTKTTLSGAYYSHIAIPIGVFLLLLTGVGPLLAWRASSFKSLRRNFILPGVAFGVTAIACIAVGLKPWADEGVFYSLMTFSLAAAVATAVASEFLRGAAVVRRQTGKDYLSSTILLVRRSTRRYGGYLVHFGVVIIFIGFAGYAFNRSAEKPMGPGDKMEIGPYTLVNLGNTQESNANYDSEFSLLDVYQNGKKVLAQSMAPEKRVYAVNGQPQTMVANHSTMQWDLYVVYEGRDSTTGLPIIKAFLNPLVMWIWVGLVVVVLGTLVALVPSLSPSRAAVAVPVPQPGPMQAAVGVTGGGD